METSPVLLGRVKAGEWVGFPKRPRPHYGSRQEYVALPLTASDPVSERCACNVVGRLVAVYRAAEAGDDIGARRELLALLQFFPLPAPRPPRRRTRSRKERPPAAPG